MISLSLSNFIKTILNIQDNNISFPEEDYCQIIQKDNLLIKVFKGFLKSNYCACPHCNSKNIVKNGSRNRKIKYIPIQNYNIQLELNVQRYICKECKKTFSPPTNIVGNNSSISNNLKYSIALELQKTFLLHLLLRDTIFLFLLFKELWITAIPILKLISNIYLKLFVLMNLSLLKILMVLCHLFLLIIELKVLLILLKIENLILLQNIFQDFL